MLPRFSGASSFKDLYTIVQVSRLISFSIDGQRIEKLTNRETLEKQLKLKGEGEGEVAFFSAKRWDRRNRADLIESATPCYDAQVVGLYRDSNPLRLTILAAMSEDYTTAPQHLQTYFQENHSLWMSTRWYQAQLFHSFVL